MHDLFAMREASAHEYDTKVSFSALEIYNEKIYDLLVESQTKQLFLREDGKNRIVVANLSARHPESAPEVLEHVIAANGRRKQSPTHANAFSSRSHAIIQISISRTRRAGAVADFKRETVTSTSTTSTLSIIDLAGSERAAATHNMGKRMTEGANINKSLLALANVFNALIQRAGMSKSRAKNEHVPYRNSQLTRLLQFSLGGNCRTLMIACVSPCSSSKEDISNTLKYASRAMTISTSVTQNSHEGQRNISQFLETIAAQNATIEELTRTITVLKAATPAGVQENLDKDRTELREVRREMQQHAASDTPILAAAARARAQTDVINVQLTALRSKLSAITDAYPAGSDVPEEVDAVRRALKNEMRKVEDSLPQGNDIVHGQRAQTHLDGMMRAMRCRTFGKLGREETLAIELEARLQSAESEKAKIVAREQAYQASTASLARANAERLLALAKCTASLQVAARELETALADGARDGLASQVQLIAAGLLAVARSGEASLAGSEAPPGVQPVVAANRVAAPPARRLSAASSSFGGDARPRASIRGGLTGPHMPSIRASPVNQRVASRSHIGTPKRAFHSPRKRASAMPGSARVRLGSTKKQMTWKDEATLGRAGPLESVRTITPDSSLSAIGARPSSSSPEAETTETSIEEEWQEEEESTGLGDGPGVTASMPAIRPPTAAPAVGVVGEEAAIPEWKKNRQMMGKGATSLLGALAEDGAGNSSGIRLGGSMGPPQRSANAGLVLASGAQQSVPSSAARRSLLTSQAAVDNASGSAPQASTSRLGIGRPAQRRPSIGPIRHERKRSRSSILPIAEEGDESMALAATMSPRQVSAGSASHPRLSLVAECKQRATSLGRSPKKAARRPSSIGLPSGLAGGARPRQSISGMAGRLPPALATLGSPPAGAPAGDASMIAPPTITRAFPSLASSAALRTSPVTASAALGPLRGPPPALRKFASMASLSGAAAGNESGAALRPIWRP